jgi:acetyl esterase/lipase
LKRLFVSDTRDAGLVREDAVFNAAHGLSLTTYRQNSPAKPATKRPYILIIHGGGWDSGQRDDFPTWSRALASLGYVILDADYRLAPAAPWPAQREDILGAMRYAQANAEKLGLDPERCVLFGRSAGAHLALATAYLANDPRIKGVISFYGPADLFFAYKYGEPDDILRSLDLLKNLCGGTPETAKACYQNASPYFHVNAKTPPTLLAHGDIDALVWNQQSIRLAAQLKAAGRFYQFIELSWATHAFDYNFQGPSGQLAWYAVKRFLATNLQN